MIPAEIDALLTEISNAQTELFMLSYALGSYATNPHPRKAHHDGLRTAAVDCVAATRRVVTKTEGVLRLGREAEKEQRAKSLHVVGETD